MATSIAVVNKKKQEELVAGAERMECCPVSEENSLCKAVTKALLAPFKQAIIAVTKSTQYDPGRRQERANLSSGHNSSWKPTCILWS